MCCSSSCLASFFAKDTQPADTVAGAVYGLGCGTCPKVYIGETAQMMAKRIKEHKSQSRNGHPQLSAVANHVLDTGQEIHWYARVLHKESNTLRRKVHEALEINKLSRGHKICMNLDRGMEIRKLWLDLI